MHTSQPLTSPQLQPSPSLSAPPHPPSPRARLLVPAAILLFILLLSAALVVVRQQLGQNRTQKQAAEQAAARKKDQDFTNGIFGTLKRYDAPKDGRAAGTYYIFTKSGLEQVLDTTTAPNLDAKLEAMLGKSVRATGTLQVAARTKGGPIVGVLKVQSLELMGE